eukprot:SAG11_NODE_9774_length_881_cov_1.658568_1_plen_142_part_01
MRAAAGPSLGRSAGGGLPSAVRHRSMRALALVVLLTGARAADPCDCTPSGCPATPPKGCKRAQDVLWLPLGDSITWGCNSPTIQDCHADSASYRVPLALALSQHPLGPSSGTGFNISTMGTLETGPPYVPRQWLKHEGHPGW